jgi:hypothetical protein
MADAGRQQRQSASEARLLDIRRQAEEQGRVEDAGIRPAGSPFPIASPATGYYGQHLLKEPQWTWMVPLYFFVGGAAGSLGVIGSLADVVGDEFELAKHARWMAVGGAMLSSGLLIADLGRPSRFLNMLRVFKPQSTMSMGSWVLSAFATSAAASSFADLLRSKFGDALPVKVISGAGRAGSTLFGMPFHNYTGVLIGTSVIPVWNDRVSTLPGHFGMSGLQSAVALLELAGHHDHRALNLLGLLSASMETWEQVDMATSPSPASAPLKRGLSGALVQTGAWLSGPVPLLFRLASCLPGKHPRMRRIAAYSAIAGSLFTRYGWIEAGSGSARDWRLALQAPPKR